jgi:hypothetical protein
LRKFSIWHSILLVGTAFVVLLLATGFIKAVADKGIGSGEAASWLQAIGGILAIVAAFAVATGQHKADRALEMDIRNIDESRRFEAVKAILARANAVAKIVGEAWQRSAMDSIDSNFDNYVLDCKASVEALPIFDIPNADLIVYVVNLPRALQELNQVLAQARIESDSQEQIEFPAADDLGPKINAVLGMTARGGEICDKQIELRKR